MIKLLRRLLTLAVACGTVTFARAQDAGFESLFNGRDFTGWRFSLQKTGDPWPDNWKIKDGVIYLTGAMRPNLVTTREFGDFEVRFEWRALTPKFNGGFYIRCRPDAGNNQIRVDKSNEGAFLAGSIRGAKAAPTLQKAVGEWNEWRVLVKGAAVTLWCNGKLAWEATGLAPARGHIGLQAEGTPMEFRNLQVRELR
ncbi:MAG: hypothetical protein FD161_2588 [Limisphaerales bacterium]|nr:MAG: hypothetical protein FD161_2588 [Limisphaerales bacterium]KAG0508510.1 MAG: hypothetical protein E1N63_2339 [Limisphaerales bacterium]TXT48936.1 MAG: hypothetical protein FD140_3404 [Limisphaerales bacterium]